MNLIDISNLFVRFGRHAVLEDISMHVAPREIITIVGPNGSGKTTLLRTIIGAIKFNEGIISRSKGLQFGYVPQRLYVDAALPITVRRFLSLPHYSSDAAINDSLIHAGVGNMGDRQMIDLSGGQFQRVLLARALLGDPDLLILDEATQGLDQPGSAAFYRQIELVRHRLGCAVLMVSHELHVVMAASDRVICLNGHICCQGAPAQVAEAPEYQALFGSGTQGALALYQHDHTHSHHEDHAE
ncbi:MAG: zinc ABC transporter ATP-binding protein ZnuC [Acidiferrobacteraceae bacterium]|nr:zinc ABC transporter ATP-binding protein ZnuC [Acidiferrobacteraceae bacterium]